MVRDFINSKGLHIMMTDCVHYEMDDAICDDVGEPKGQCALCGAKWWEHPVAALTDENDIKTANEIQENQ